MTTANLLIENNVRSTVVIELLFKYGSSIQIYIYVRLLTAHNSLLYISFTVLLLQMSVVVRCLYFLHPAVYNEIEVLLDHQHNSYLFYLVYPSLVLIILDHQVATVKLFS